jgi:hypothetical protein
MTTRIAYGNTGTGQQVSDFVNEVEVTLAKGRRLLAKLNSMSSGSDWTSLEGEIGGMTPGTGQALWTLIATAMGQIDSAAVAELARLDRS